ncbi:MAG: MFS transporter [Micromonosporaceae bacterium]
MVPEVLRQTPFRRFWSARTISLFGDQVAMVAAPLVAALVLDAGPAEMGYLVAAGMLPHLLLSVYAGAWVDRRGRRRQTMIAADLGRAVLVLTVPAAAVLGVLTMSQLYVVGFAMGVLSVFFDVSHSTLFVSLVSRDDYVPANSLIHGSRAMSMLGGPTLGGILVEIITAPLTLIANSVSFLASAFLLGRINPVEPPTETRTSGHISAGARYIWRTPVVRAALGATATVNFFMYMIMALYVLYTTTALEMRPGALGLTIGAGAIGGVLGAIVTGKVAKRIGVGPAFAVGCVAFPAPWLILPALGGPGWHAVVLLAVANIGSGVGLMVLDISVGSIFAAIIPHRLRARVDGAYRTVNFGIKSLGALAGGGLATVYGMRPALWVAGLGAITSVLWVLGSPIPGMRTLPERSKDLDEESEYAVPESTTGGDK